MEADASADLFYKKQLPNSKQSLVDPFKAIFPRPFVSSVNLLVHAAMATNSKWYRPDFVPYFPAVFQRIWRILLHSRQMSWTPSQAVPGCGRYNTSEVSSPFKLSKIVSHSWTHPQPWDNLRLYLRMPCSIYISTTSPSTTHLPPCIPLTRNLLDNTS